MMINGMTIEQWAKEQLAWIREARRDVEKALFSFKEIERHS